MSCVSYCESYLSYGPGNPSGSKRRKPTLNPDPVVQASRLYPAELALSRLQRDPLVTVVTLYRAIGGGWQLTDDQWLHAP